MIEITKLVYGEQTFTWADSDGEVVHVAVDRLNAWLLGTDFPLIKADLPALLEMVRQYIAIDYEHVRQLPDDSWKYPITLLEWSARSHVIADGGHRIEKLHQLGFPAIAAWDVPRKIWEKFTITGIPGDARLWHELNQDPTRYRPADRVIYGR